MKDESAGAGGGAVALPERSPRVLIGALTLGVIGLLLTGASMASGNRAAFFSYLTAYLFWLSIVLGALIVNMIQHAINTVWFVVLRRLAEAASATLIVLALLFLPLLPGLAQIYPWVGAAQAGAQVELSAAKLAWLNVPFFLVRALLYFSAWLITVWLLAHWSKGQRAGNGQVLAQRQRVLSAGLLPLVGFAMTFASFDWLMSLHPLWYSTVFGVYYFSGSVLTFLSLLAVLAFLVQRSGHLTREITVSHTHALGKLMLVFLILWAYMAFAQLLLIWIADIPEEAVWYVIRTQHGWRTIALFLVAGHFLLPFFLLLSWRLKRVPATLAAVGVWLVLMQFIEMYWLVMPALYGSGPRVSWLDLAALMGIGGVLAAYGMWWLRKLPLVPLGDPRLEQSLEFHTL